MNKQELLAEAEAFARAELAGDSSGHDWWHIARVRALARTIAEREGADGFICELAALLHDLADAKIAGDEASGLARVRGWLTEHSADAETITQVMRIIETLSFAGGTKPVPATLEGRVVQDADRLDALGAIGVARAFAYGGSRGRLLYDPGVPPQEYASAAAYHTSAAPTINHFYEKLLLLKDRMNTAYARRLAEERHRYLQTFLDEFFAEWVGER
jgi:uncharacterized protein